ncbi:MAG: TlpA family protein disulfide reductase [Bryobacterales bacterium]|nr:TlpA family protein disulfide reductase [Bryobacterales bacterium]
MQGVKLETYLRGGIAALLAVFSWVVFDTLRERLVSVGDTAPKFAVSTDAGRDLSRSDFGGELLVLNFWATWCPPCIEEIPSLDAFQKHFADRGVVVLGISVDKDEDVYRKFLQRVNVSFQTARDPEARINRQYGTVKFPETYIINRQGRVLRKVVSSRDWMDPSMLADVESLLGGGGTR